MPRACSVSLCPRIHYAHGFCRFHYDRWKRHGTPFFTTTPMRDMTLEERFWFFVAKDEQANTCWLWQGEVTYHGYGRLSLHRKHIQAHRLAWQIAHGPIPDGLFVLHKCDVPLCVRNDTPGHLWLGTQADNMQDKVAKGRQAKGDNCGFRLHPESRLFGERNGFAKLSNAQREQIRHLYATTNMSQSAIARQFGVHHSCINKIVHQKKQ